MSDTLITKSQYDALAAAASGSIRKLAGLIALTGDINIVVSQTEPEDDNAYWIYFTDDEE